LVDSAEQNRLDELQHASGLSREARCVVKDRLDWASWHTLGVDFVDDSAHQIELHRFKLLGAVASEGVAFHVEAVANNLGLLLAELAGGQAKQALGVSGSKASGPIAGKAPDGVLGDSAQEKQEGLLLLASAVILRAGGGRAESFG
jgi:hypothetical protein